jgi:hypothetical protein
MQHPFELNGRVRSTYEAIERSLALGGDGATSLQLAAELHGEEFELLQKMTAFVETLSRSKPWLEPDEVACLRGLATQLENGKRRGAALSVLVQKIVRAPATAPLLKRAHAAHLTELFRRAMIEDVQARVHELRAHLMKSGPGPDGAVLNVTRAPYRLVRVPATLDPRDAQGLEALYMVFDRFAWRSKPSEIETNAFSLAQQRLRHALKTGKILTDDGTLISERRGIPKCELSDYVRDKLDWIVEVSHMLQQVFDHFYGPFSTTTDPDGLCVIAPWALPHAPKVVRFSLAARNEILHTVNPLFESIGRRPYPLVSGHDFPAVWVPSHTIPDDPPRMSPDQLRRSCLELRQIGVHHHVEGRPRPVRGRLTA